jgi:hypothetical protein
MPSNIPRNMACSARRHLAAKAGDPAAMNPFQALDMQSARCLLRYGSPISFPHSLGKAVSAPGRSHMGSHRMWERRE